MYTFVISVMVLFTLFEYLPIVDSMPISFTQRGFSTQKYFKPEVNFEVNPLLNIFVAISRHPLDLWSVGVKFIHSEKATKFCEISTLNLTVTT